nr:MAG TPA: hypothetical protein [Caudoviricetes sp.]
MKGPGHLCIVPCGTRGLTGDLPSSTVRQRGRLVNVTCRSWRLHTRDSAHSRQGSSRGRAERLPTT